MASRRKIDVRQRLCQVAAWKKSMLLGDHNGRGTLKSVEDERATKEGQVMRA